MAFRGWFQRWRTRRGLFVLFALLLIVGVGGFYAWGWWQLSAARRALQRYHPDAAQRHLTRYLAVWSGSVRAHLLASRAARQRGDFEAAAAHLHACQPPEGGTTDEIALEWALLQAASGNLGEVEEFLQRRAELEPPLAPLVWEAVSDGYIRVYRMLDALACLERWLALEPTNVRAMELRGQAYQNGKQARKAIAEFRRVLELDPSRDDARWRFVLCLLDLGSYDEALDNLQLLEKRRPNDPELQVRLARCHNLAGRGDTARSILDGVLRAHPHNALALRTRGQFALADRQPGEAETWLRQAVEQTPSDYQSHWLLLQALQQQNRKQEAADQLARTEHIKQQAERLGELTGRKLFERPLEAALHYETGVLLMRSGHKSTGEGWLKSALSLDPDYEPAHAALAEYYDSVGDKRAEQHRRR